MKMACCPFAFYVTKYALKIVKIMRIHYGNIAQ